MWYMSQATLPLPKVNIKMHHLFTLCCSASPIFHSLRILKLEDLQIFWCLYSYKALINVSSTCFHNDFPTRQFIRLELVRQLDLFKYLKNINLYGLEIILAQNFGTQSTFPLVSSSTPVFRPGLKTLLMDFINKPLLMIDKHLICCCFFKDKISISFCFMGDSLSISLSI